VLLLTKPIGTGIVIHGHATGDTSDAELAAACGVMAELNRIAGELLPQMGVHAATDITGFGLIGHALDMLSHGRAGIELMFDRVPLLPRVAELAERGNLPPGSMANAEYTACRAEFSGPLADTARAVLNDAQTSGGLLVALPEAYAEEFQLQLTERGYPLPAAVIGRVTADNLGKISVSCPKTNTH
jgi:selenide,water dikinase